jgi:hypothetical protein
MAAPEINLPPGPVAAVGDIHGCGEEFRELLGRLDAVRPGIRVVPVGDLLTKGPRPDLVVRAILDRREAGHPIDLVCGNHDQLMLAALHLVGRGVPSEDLGDAERECLETLRRARLVRNAHALMTEACDTIVRSGRTADGRPFHVVHGGIDPALGLRGTPDPVKVHRKSFGAEPHWWEAYRGEDGLIIVGHQPIREPLVLRRDGLPIAVNVDTGCVRGNRLTAYLTDDDRLVSVASRQPRGVDFERMITLDPLGRTARPPLNPFANPSVR